ncbi:ATP-binding protein [Arenimonas sp.]|uniref:ATP-binding protein n=1 Tax=Arenimonas sp. TaxID=1872635 RepID=UPI0039E30877
MGGTRSIQFGHRVNHGLLAMAFALIVATSFVSVWSINALGESIGRVAHTDEVKAAIMRLDASLGDVESNGLRYMVTGESEYLMSHRYALDEMMRTIDQLGPMTQDNPYQVKNLRATIELYNELTERSRLGLAMKRQAMLEGDERAPLERVREGSGKRLIERMRKVFRQMLVEEDRLSTTRADERDALIKQTNATVLIANGLALVAGLLGFLAIRRSQRESESLLLAELKATQARRDSEEKSVFLANMSHEIRTPMNAIFGFTQLLSETVTGTVEREWVSSIKKSGQVLLSLINDVLDLSKIEAGKLKLNPQPTDPGEVLSEIIDLFYPQAAAKGIFLTGEVEGGPARALMLDAQRLRQILMNLISNAVKYTEQGGVMVRIALRSGHDPRLRDLSLVVSDSGVGIEADQRPRIFDPFHQADAPDGRVRPGTGLGLSITRRLVDAMKGRIHVDSEPGKGSVFLVEIPDVPLATEQALSPQASDEAVDFDSLPPLNVLVVDDVEWNTEIARGYLRNSRHTVNVVSDGEAAVAATRRLRPDVVLMDLRMPRMNGYEARDEIRADPSVKGTAIVAVTASSAEHEDRAQYSGFDGYVRKPYTPKDLYSVLHRLFGPAPPASATASHRSNQEATLAKVPPPSAEVAAAWRELQAEFLPLRRSMRMREIDAAATRLRELAERWPNTDLGHCAQRLHAAVERFDVVAVKQLLDTLAEWPEASCDD